MIGPALLHSILPRTSQQNYLDHPVSEHSAAVQHYFGGPIKPTASLIFQIYLFFLKMGYGYTNCLQPTACISQVFAICCMHLLLFPSLDGLWENRTWIILWSPSTLFMTQWMSDSRAPKYCYQVEPQSKGKQSHRFKEGPIPGTGAVSWEERKTIFCDLLTQH